MTHNSNKYDLILILGYYRNVTYYLNIIKQLSGEFRIGLFPIPLNAIDTGKSQNWQHAFTAKCIELGAELIDKDSFVFAKVTHFPHSNYSNAAYRRIKSKITSVKKVCTLGLTKPGKFDDLLDGFGINTIYVIDKKFFDVLVKKRNKLDYYHNRELVETGYPYKKYPLSYNFEVDYILTIPTPLSFSEQKDKWQFMENVLKIFKEIGKEQIIAYKQHNSLEKNYLFPNNFRAISKIISSFSPIIMRSIFMTLASALPGRMKKLFYTLYTAFLHEKILKRVTPMEALTNDHFLALEIFLPHVRKGLIGGCSNTIWGALYFELPFYNCVDLQSQNRYAETKAKKMTTTKEFYWLMEYLHVPYCEGKLRFSNEHSKIVENSTRQGDVISILRNDINKL